MADFHTILSQLHQAESKKLIQSIEYHVHQCVSYGLLIHLNEVRPQFQKSNLIAYFRKQGHTATPIQKHSIYVVIDPDKQQSRNS